MGNLSRHFVLSLGLVLLHQVRQNISLISRLTACARQHGFSLVMHSQLMHLLRELYLQIGVQSQPEQSFCGGTCSIDIAAVDRHP